MPYKISVLAGSVNVGSLGIPIVGIFWLIAALAFVVCSVGVRARVPWWLPVTVIVAASSLFLCIIGWPDSRIGVFVNIAVVAFLLIGRRAAWLP